MTKKRLLKRNKIVEQKEEKETRETLGEFNEHFVLNVHSKYSKLNFEGFFDLVFDAKEESPKKNADNLLKVLNISH